MATVLERPRYDRSIVEGPLQPAVWKIAWPTMLTNVVGGLQGIVDHVLVGHLVGFTGNAAIGVSWQIILVVIVFISSLFSGMSVLVSRFAGAGDHDKVDRTVYQAFLTATFLSFGVMAPLGYLPRRGCWTSSTPRRPSGRGAAVPSHHVRVHRRHDDVFHAGRRRCDRPAMRERR